jgi:hypothetical protein
MSNWEPPRIPPTAAETDPNPASHVPITPTTPVAKPPWWRRRLLRLPAWAWGVGVVGLLVLAGIFGEQPDDEIATAEDGAEPSISPAAPESATTEVTTAEQSDSVPPTTTAAEDPVPSATPSIDTVPGSHRALDVLAFITVENERGADYDRNLFGYPNDADGDGCDVRAEVLQRDSLIDIGPDCPVTTGEWRSSYDGAVVTDSELLELDHVVSLKEAWDSGASSWDDSRRVSFANDVEDPRTLRVVLREMNQDKADKDPSNWLPPSDDVVCTYLADFVAIKARWGLSMDESEFGRIRNVLTDRCPDQAIGPWPDAPPVVPTTLPPSPPTTPAPLSTQPPALIPALPPTPTTTQAPAPTTTRPPAPPPTQPRQPFLPQPPSNCDASYPGVCIPPYPPDLNCGDVSFRRFAVVPPDPHGFDGDNDGIGCES